MAERIGRYELLDVIGSGGFATVYRAWDGTTRRQVALKALLPHYAQDPAIQRRFLTEARTLADLGQRNVVTLLDVGEADGRPYIVMPLITGPTLKRLVEEQGPLPESHAASIVAGLAAALDYLHIAGIVHRDLKPANVMLAGDGRPILLDFGIVRAAAGTGHTHTNAYLGTPEFTAPEQVRNHEVGPATDIYALGALTFYLLAGHAPFVGDMAHVLHAQAFEPAPDVRAFRPELSDQVASAIAAALAKEPDARPPTAGAFAALMGLAPTAGPATPATGAAPAAAGVAGRARESGTAQSAGPQPAVTAAAHAIAVVDAGQEAPEPAPAVDATEAPETAGDAGPFAATPIDAGASGPVPADPVAHEFEAEPPPPMDEPADTGPPGDATIGTPPATGHAAPVPRAASATAASVPNPSERRWSGKRRALAGAGTAVVMVAALAFTAMAVRPGGEQATGAVLNVPAPAVADTATPASVHAALTPGTTPVVLATAPPLPAPSEARDLRLFAAGGYLNGLPSIDTAVAGSALQACFTYRVAGPAPGLQIVIAGDGAGQAAAVPLPGERGTICADIPPTGGLAPGSYAVAVVEGDRQLAATGLWLDAPPAPAAATAVPQPTPRPAPPPPAATRAPAPPLSVPPPTAPAVVPIATPAPVVPSPAPAIRTPPPVPAGPAAPAPRTPQPVGPGATTSR